VSPNLSIHDSLVYIASADLTFIIQVSVVTGVIEEVCLVYCAVYYGLNGYLDTSPNYHQTSIRLQVPLCETRELGCQYLPSGYLIGIII